MKHTEAGRPVMLVIMDGWGWREEADGNAIRLARTPNLDRYADEYPWILLEAAGKAVGLPDGQMGNSEVGHLNLGAGRIVYQELTRINMAIEDGSFYHNEILGDLFKKIREKGTVLHLMGLVSDGGVHSQIEHLYALIRMAKENGLDRVVVHAFMDGRDTLPTSGAGYIAELVRTMGEVGIGSVGTVVGRYYAMDRDRRWDRIELAYRALVSGEGEKDTDPVEAVKKAYERGETDEFIKPVVMEKPGGGLQPRLSNGDGVVFFNFRADRARQLTMALTSPSFSEFSVEDRPQFAGYVTMTRYDEHFDLPVAFPPQHLDRILGEEVSRAGLRQLRIAETEKYAHVTYFFNGGEEDPFPLEDRCLIQSPRDVATYDQRPQMSAHEVADELVSRISREDYSLIVVNFANGDMVGHTGILPAAIKACEVVDECVGRITEQWRRRGGVALITADHGNAEVMIAPDGGPATAHTTNMVPLYLIDDEQKGAELEQGILADVAPTILSLMGLEVPSAMTGKILIRN